MDDTLKKLLIGFGGVAVETFVGFVLYAFYGDVYNLFTNPSNPTWGGILGIIAVISGIVALIILIIAWRKEPSLYYKLSYISIHFSQINSTPSNPSCPVYIVDSRSDSKQAYSVTTIPAWLEQSVKHRKFRPINHSSEFELRADLKRQKIPIKEAEPTPEMLGVRARLDGSLSPLGKKIDHDLLSKLKEHKQGDLKLAMIYLWPLKTVYPPNKRLLIKKSTNEAWEGISHDLELVENGVIASQNYSRYPWEISLRFWCWRNPSIFHHYKYVRWPYDLNKLLEDS